MNEEELTEYIFEQLVESSVEIVSGLPLSPISLCKRFIGWLTEDDPAHKRAAAKAVQKYRRSGFCSDFQSDFRSDFRK